VEVCLSFINYYEVLGVNKKASHQDIKKRYREIALSSHPDHNGGSKSSEEQFKHIQEAYEVLIDPNLRRKHDECLGIFQKYKSTQEKSYQQTELKKTRCEYENINKCETKRNNKTADAVKPISNYQSMYLIGYATIILLVWLTLSYFGEKVFPLFIVSSILYYRGFWSLLTKRSSKLNEIIYAILKFTFSFISGYADFSSLKRQERDSKRG